MKKKIEEGFLDEFKGIEDPRVERCKLYSIEEILFLTLTAIVCGCESWNDIENFGRSKEGFLKEYLTYKNGIPSDDTLRRFFRALNPDHFQECFVNWMKRFRVDLKQGVIALDGKTSRRTFDGEGKPLHLVSAFASETRLVLGQEKVADKTNEITAIKGMLEWLDIRSATVTIDAIGCQTDIATVIVEKGGDFVLGLKGNQGTLHEDVKLFFEVETANQFSEYAFDSYGEIEKGHGRIETRIASVCTQVDWLTERHPHWHSISAIIQVHSQRLLSDRITQDTRYYIASAPKSAKALLEDTRAHWSIENSLHWVLDMCFGDDQSRIRKDNAPMNMAILKHIALNMIRIFKATQPKLRTSLIGLRRQAGWDSSLLNLIIRQNL